MKKNISILFLLITIISCKTSVTPVSNVVLKTDAQEVEKIITFLASDKLNGREAGSEGIDQAASYIENKFKTNGVKPYFKTYRDTLSNFDEPAYNIVGLIEGTDAELKNEYIVIGAHYDHIGSAKPVNGDAIANGANDNASGTAAVLEIAKYFGTYNTNKRSLLFVLFSAEEKGLLGSEHLASKLKKENLNLYAMVNFEMIGVPMQRDELMYITGYKESNMAERINAYAGKNIVGFLPKAGEYQLFKRSDNYPFYTEFKVPAQTVSTFDFENFEYYHHVDDETNEINFEHMATVINEMIPVLEKMANAPSDEIKLN